MATQRCNSTEYGKAMDKKEHTNHTGCKIHNRMLLHQKDNEGQLEALKRSKYHVHRTTHRIHCYPSNLYNHPRPMGADPSRPFNTSHTHVWCKDSSTKAPWYMHQTLSWLQHLTVQVWQNIESSLYVMVKCMTSIQQKRGYNSSGGLSLFMA